MVDIKYQGSLFIHFKLHLPTTMAPHQGKPRSTCMNSSMFWISPTGVWLAKPNSAKLGSAAAACRTSSAVGAASTTSSAADCATSGVAAADKSSVGESTTGGGGEESSAGTTVATVSSVAWNWNCLNKTTTKKKHTDKQARGYTYLFCDWLCDDRGGDGRQRRWKLRNFQHWSGNGAIVLWDLTI